MNLRLPRHTPVIVLAAGCLLLGSTGGAVAGAMITGKQIKDNTVTTKDIKNGTLAPKDLSKSTRRALSGAPGPTGATGPAGATGGTGPRGFSAWDTIPSGVTVTGRFFRDEPTGPTAGWVAENVSLPAKAPEAPVGYGFGADSLAYTTTDPACTGAYNAPTAPAGRVCVYLEDAFNIDDARVRAWSSPQQQPYTFYLNFRQESAAVGSYDFWGSWAYTAP